MHRPLTVHPSATFLGRVVVGWYAYKYIVRRHRLRHIGYEPIAGRIWYDWRGRDLVV
jgi:hypothetical protein